MIAIRILNWNYFDTEMFSLNNICRSGGGVGMPGHGNSIDMQQFGFNNCHTWGHIQTKLFAEWTQFIRWQCNRRELCSIRFEKVHEWNSLINSQLLIYHLTFIISDAKINELLMSVHLKSETMCVCGVSAFWCCCRQLVHFECLTRGNEYVHHPKFIWKQ